MTECDKLKITEYNEGKLEGTDFFSLEEHLKECPECSSFQKSSLKLQNLLNSWEEKVEFSKDFDKRLLSKAEILSDRQKNISSLFAFTRKTAVAFCLLLIAVLAYKNTLYDTSLQNLKAISKTELSSKIEIRDFKLFASHRLCRELADLNSDPKSLMSYELMLSVPENILLDEQKSDLRELINEGIRNKEAGRNVVLKILDGGVNVFEGVLKLDLSFAAAGKFKTEVPKAYKQAALDFDNEKYDKAFDGYRAVYEAGKDELACRSSLFRMAFIKDMARSRKEASEYYAMVSVKYPLSVQALMAGEMNSFLKQKNSIEKKIEKLKAGSDAKAYFKIADLYLSISELSRAAEFYNYGLYNASEPRASRARLNIGWCCKNTGRYEEAVKMFEGAGVSGEKNFRSFVDYELALSYLKTGAVAKAEAVSGQNEENKEDNMGIYNTLIKKYFKAVNSGQ